MSDAGRKDFSDKVQEKATPDSQKSTAQQLKEGITGTTDKISRDVQPDSQKSTGQSVTDKASRGKDDNESTLDKAKGAVGLGDKH